jgi:hypothetical protein
VLSRRFPFVGKTSKISALRHMGGVPSVESTAEDTPDVWNSQGLYGGKGFAAVGMGCPCARLPTPRNRNAVPFRGNPDRLPLIHFTLHLPKRRDKLRQDRVPANTREGPPSPSKLADRADTNLVLGSPSRNFGFILGPAQKESSGQFPNDGDNNSIYT